MRLSSSLLVNFLIFQAGWFACALGAGNGQPHISAAVVVFLLALHLWRSPYRRRDLSFILLVGCSGTLIDSFLGYLGVLRFAGQWYAPVWLLGLWMLFATTVHYSLRWLQGRYLCLALLGSVGGMLSYYGGYLFGALQLGYPMMTSLACIAAVWAVLTPLIFWLASRPVFAAPRLVVLEDA